MKTHQEQFDFAFGLADKQITNSSPSTFRSSSQSFSRSTNEKKHIQASFAVAKEVERILSGESQVRELTWQHLFEICNSEFEGSMAEGSYTSKDAYDAMELGVNLYIGKGQSTQFKEIESSENLDKSKQEALVRIASLRNLLKKLPTQTKRTSETDEYQQFSTIPTLAYAAAWVGNITPSDIVLEPSAGVGGLGIFASNEGATLYANEYSPRRANLLRQLGIAKEIYQENAEQLHNVLPEDIRPSVVLMNPPFSATAGRMYGVRDTFTATSHLQQALTRLRPGGRLVAIVGEGMALDKPRFYQWWQSLRSQYSVRANIQINGQEYSKYGTTWNNQLVVIDKIQLKAEAKPIGGRVEKIEDLIPILEGIRYNRPEIQPGDTYERTQSRRTFSRTLRTTRPELHSREPDLFSIGLDTRKASDVSHSSRVRKFANGAKPSGIPASSQGERRTSSSSTNGLGLVAGSSSSQPEERNDRASNSLEIVKHEVPPQEGLSNSVFEGYTPRIRVLGAKPSPIKLQESAAMASVPPPMPSYRPKLPQYVIESGALTEHALESVILAGNAYQEMFEIHYTHEERREFERRFGKPPVEKVRRGFFIGDGTGAGKGRQVVGVMLDNMMQDRHKHIWITEKPALFSDAKRDTKDVYNLENKLFDVAKTKITEPLPRSQGIAFISYSTLRSQEKQPDPGKAPRTRLEQLIEWAGDDFDGVLAFDESHNMSNNITVKGQRGISKPSAQALAGVELQRRLPNARVLYLSATGATEVKNLGYAERLGLWGEGTCFSDKQEFITEIETGGVAAMELVARDAKALGVYVARSISWDEVTYETLVHSLSPEQREIYDTLAGAWQTVLSEIDEALEIIGVVEVKDDKKMTLDSRGKGSALSAFWGSHQRFFNQVITAMKMPTVLQAVEDHVSADRSVVLQLVNTNESQQKRALDRLAREAEEGEQVDLESLDMTPRDILMQMVEHCFPIVQREVYLDEDKNRRSRIAHNREGAPIINRQAVAMRDALLDRLSMIHVPDGPLEMLLNHFGKDAVAEVTGRTQRIVWGEDEHGNRRKVIERRTKSHGIKEAQDFQDGKRNILVFSQAGGTGRSYHSDRKAKNHKKRVHILLQPGWSAPQAVQGFGRTHRNNQVSAPHYVLATTDIAGEKRFMSSIARRLDQLGALTKGQRQTGSQGFFKSSDNLESPEAAEALRNLYHSVFSKQVEALSLSTFLNEMGLKLLDADTGQLRGELPPIPQFLNRLLSLNLATQEKVFAAFSERLEHAIEIAQRNGTLDQGLENLRANSTEVLDEKIVFKDLRTSSETKYFKLRLTHPANKVTWEEAVSKAKEGFWRNSNSGRVWAAVGVTKGTRSTGELFEDARLINVTNSQWIDLKNLKNPKIWEPLSSHEAASVWKDMFEKSSNVSTEIIHLISGTLLPIWDRIKGKPKIVRVQTDDGKRMIGRVVQSKDLVQVLESFGVEVKREAYSIQKVVQEMLENRKQVRLSNNWRIRLCKVSNEDRLELVGPSLANRAEMESKGIFGERIQYKTRFFIPKPDAVKIISTLLQGNRRIIEISENQTQATRVGLHKL